MNVMVAMFILGLGLVVVIIACGQFAERSKDRVSKLKLANQRLRTEGQEVLSQVRALKESENTLKSRLAYRREKELEVQAAMQQAGNAARKSAPTSKDVIDILLDENLVTPEQVMKAEQYRTNSKRLVDLEDVLVLLGLVTADTVKRIKSQM